MLRFGLGGLLLISFTLFASDIEQQIDLNPRHFPNNTAHTNDVALGYKFKYHHYTKNDALLAFAFNSAVSNKDDGRNYIDVNEFFWNKQADQYELKIGIDTVFWGVAESTNVVDIINQKNNLTTDNKDKLGELMLHYSYFLDNGNIDAFYLPSFRQQAFIDASYPNGNTIDSATFEDKNKPSFALRQQSVIGNLDLGLSYFNGIDRQARFGSNNGASDLYYPNLTQFGLDAQLTKESILWKLEYANKQYTNSSEYASVYGFEYLTVGDWNVNFLLEHNKNSVANQLMQNDMLLGVRFDFNDAQGSEALITLIHDLDYGSKILGVEGSKRLNSNSKITFEARYFDPTKDDATLKKIKDNGNLSITLSYYF